MGRGHSQSNVLYQPAIGRSNPGLPGNAPVWLQEWWEHNQPEPEVAKQLQGLIRAVDDPDDFETLRNHLNASRLRETGVAAAEKLQKEINFAASLVRMCNDLAILAVAEKPQSMSWVLSQAKDLLNGLRQRKTNLEQPGTYAEERVEKLRQVIEVGEAALALYAQGRNGITGLEAVQILHSYTGRSQAQLAASEQQRLVEALVQFNKGSGE